MDTGDFDDEEQDRHLTRSNSWSHTQRPVFLDNTRKQSMGPPARPNGLSCIYETDDATAGNHHDADFVMDQQRNRSKSMSNGTATQMKKRRHSYTELIASAILSSPEKRKTLAEIYDWFVLNVPSFKDQRYMHSSLGWKNAVRHNLSVQTCFKRVKRHGMEKPSWWTVDMTEVAKRRLVLRPTLNADNVNGNSDDSEAFLPPRRNTYSGPHPSPQSHMANDVSGGQKMAYRVASTNDLISTTNLHQFSNASTKRSHYTPIRPALSTQHSDMTMFSVGNGYHGHRPEESPYGSMAGLNGNETNMDDNVFLKPCAVDTSPAQSKHMIHSPTLMPSVTLVCKESPTSSQPYRQAQLEVSFHAASDGGSHSSSVSSPGVYSWASSASSSCSQTSPSTQGQMNGSSLGHFNTWPNIAESLNMANRTDEGSNKAGMPNQILRVKTVWGNVEDINFNGLLPMRTVVKCDGGTQTDGDANAHKSVVSKNFAKWEQHQSCGRYPQQHNGFHDSTLATDLPEDLAGLQIEGDLDCNIDEVLGATLEAPNSKPVWGWSWTNSPFDQLSYTDCADTAPMMNINSMTHSPFNTSSAMMDMSEM